MALRRAFRVGARIRMGSSFRWNDGEMVCRHRSAHALRAWVPAFAGMTAFLWMAHRKLRPKQQLPGLLGSRDIRSGETAPW